MAQRISQQRFDALKRQATRLMRTRPGLTRTNALDEIARQEHYANWSLLARTVDVTSGTAPPKRGFGQHQLTLTARVRRSSRTAPPCQDWQETVMAIHPALWYEKFVWIPKGWVFESPDLRDLQHQLATAKRAISFMDATGLRPARAGGRLIEREFGAYLPDHMCVWQDEALRYLATAEPYICASDALPTLAAWCQKRAWRWLLLPHGCGIWNPCLETCPSECIRHTQMIVLSPEERGADIHMVSQAWGSPRTSYEATSASSAPTNGVAHRVPSVGSNTLQ